MNTLRRFSRRAWLVHASLIFALALLLPEGAAGYWSTWSATDGYYTGSMNEYENPPEGDAWWSADSDEDGLANEQEVYLGTDPYLGDTDGDTLTDGDEVSSYFTRPDLADSDGDSLSDLEEMFFYFTDPLSADTDGGGRNDWDEVISGSNPGDSSDDQPPSENTDPWSMDSDGDGVSDAREWSIGTDAYGYNDWWSIDSDGDGVSDGQEGVNGTNPYSYDSPATTDNGSMDSDNDGLSDDQELLNGTYAYDDDSDDDGLHDGDEAWFGTNPLAADTDNDGLGDMEEVMTYGTRPDLADTDGDSLPDYMELFTSLSDPLLEDTDGGGATDGDEYQSGSNLSDPLDDYGSSGQPTAEQASQGQQEQQTNTDIAQDTGSGYETEAETCPLDGSAPGGYNIAEPYGY